MNLWNIINKDVDIMIVLLINLDNFNQQKNFNPSCNPSLPNGKEENVRK